VTTVAVIQPYFFPYAGYFRLFSGSDVVVMFDCVQFPRRGWVHRNRFTLANGEQDWLTLPVAKAERDIRIDQLQWSPNARERLTDALRRFPALESSLRARHPLVERMLELTDSDVTAYLCGLVEHVSSLLGIARPMVRSSTLGIDPALRAQERVIAVVEALGGTRYVNPSGGRELYDHDAFEARGIELRFLSEYGGRTDSVLSRLLSEPADTLATEIARETRLLR
jgi:hypothetical protein